jgi:hypothetical protein
VLVLVLILGSCTFPDPDISFFSQDSEQQGMDGYGMDMDVKMVGTVSTRTYVNGFHSFKFLECRVKEEENDGGIFRTRE